MNTIREQEEQIEPKFMDETLKELENFIDNIEKQISALQIDEYELCLQEQNTKQRTEEISDEIASKAPLRSKIAARVSEPNHQKFSGPLKIIFEENLLIQSYRDFEYRTSKYLKDMVSVLTSESSFSFEEEENFDPRERPIKDPFSEKHPNKDLILNLEDEYR